jgi:hypothetical protein
MREGTSTNMKSFAILYIALVASFSAAATTPEEYKRQAEALNEVCRQQMAKDPTDIRACKLRDQVADRAAAGGWCRKDRAWVQCAPVPNRDGRRFIPHAGDWYFAARSTTVQMQLDACARFADAGNSLAASMCRNELLNADTFLAEHARNSVLPQEGWLLCSQEIAHDLPLAARCIAAVEDVCAVTPDGKLDDFSKCYGVITSGAYLSNPAARRLKLDAPRATR